MTDPVDFFDKDFDLECVDEDVFVCDKNNINPTVLSKGLGLGKLFLAIYFAGLCLFVVIGGFYIYCSKETAKAVEKERIRQIEALKSKSSMGKVFDELVPPAPQIIETEMAEEEEEPFSDQSPMEGYFKDSDGVWRSKYDSGSDFYKDRDGVWRSRLN